MSSGLNDAAGVSIEISLSQLNVEIALHEAVDTCFCVNGKSKLEATLHPCLPFALQIKKPDGMAVISHFRHSCNKIMN
jgi:hypothetical protein